MRGSWLAADGGVAETARSGTGAAIAMGTAVARRAKDRRRDADRSKITA
jgi:hypothetical protein